MNASGLEPPARPKPRMPLDHTRLAAARLRAAELHPFLSIALYALSPVADDSRDTFAVDGRWRLYVNPVKLAEWTVLEVAGVLLHEVGHVLRDHGGRGEVCAGFDEQALGLWNIAADAEINDDLLAAGITLPEGRVTPRLLGLPGHKAAEFYYGRLAAAGEPPPAEVDCGPGCRGPGAGQHLHASEAVALPAGLSDVEALLLRRRVAELIAQHAGGRPGDVAGGWLRWAQATLQPRLDWRKLLSAKIRSSTAAVAGAADYSYLRPSRRRVPRVVLPSLRRPVPRVAVVVDTSGSVNDEQLAAAWTEVHGCLRALSIRRDLLTVYAADTAVHRLTGPLSRQISLTGGGGTDMAGAIATVLAARPAPDLVVVITDGLTPWPARRPRQDVIVVLLPARWQSKPPPSWAHVVELPQDGDEMSVGLGKFRIDVPRLT